MSNETFGYLNLTVLSHMIPQVQTPEGGGHFKYFYPDVWAVVSATCPSGPIAKTIRKTHTDVGIGLNHASVDSKRTLKSYPCRGTPFTSLKAQKGPIFLQYAPVQKLIIFTAWKPQEPHGRRPWASVLCLY